MNNTKRGSITVEAAIILPIFIIAVLTVSYVIRIIDYENTVMNSVTDECRHAAAYSYINRAGAGVKAKIEDRVNEDVPEAAFKIDRLWYLLPDGRITLDYTYMVENRMPLKMRDDFILNRGVLFRGFIGKDNSGALFTFDEMEIDEGHVTVWVFPVAGERYHQETCSYIAVDPFQCVLTDEIERKYSSCSICNSENLRNGAIVYCFRKTGKAYHDGECPTVDRYVVSMEEAEAIKRGYTPCSKCGGS